jgi:hypothetical protein
VPFFAKKWAIMDILSMRTLFGLWLIAFLGGIFGVGKNPFGVKLMGMRNL